MRRRFIVLTLLPAGVALAITAAVATPALAKGATQASITGPGLARPLTVSAEGEALPGLGDPLSTLAGQTGLFTVLFGSGSGLPDAPSALRDAAGGGLPRAEVHRYLHGPRRHPGTWPGHRADPPEPVPARGRRARDLHAAGTAGLRPAAAGQRVAACHPAADCHPDPARRPRRDLAPVHSKAGRHGPERRANASRHDRPGLADRHDRGRRRGRDRRPGPVALSALPARV